MKQHKVQLSYGQDEITKPWEPLSDEIKKGLELAAYICSMYDEGDGQGKTKPTLACIELDDGDKRTIENLKLEYPCPNEAEK